MTDSQRDKLLLRMASQQYRIGQVLHALYSETSALGYQYSPPLGENLAEENHYLEAAIVESQFQIPDEKTPDKTNHVCCYRCGKPEMTEVMLIVSGKYLCASCVMIEDATQTAIKVRDEKRRRAAIQQLRSAMGNRQSNEGQELPMAAVSNPNTVLHELVFNVKVHRLPFVPNQANTDDWFTPEAAKLFRQTYPHGRSVKIVPEYTKSLGDAWRLLDHLRANHDWLSDLRVNRDWNEFHLRANHDWLLDLQANRDWNEFLTSFLKSLSITIAQTEIENARNDAGFRPLFQDGSMRGLFSMTSEQLASAICNAILKTLIRPNVAQPPAEAEKEV